MVVTSRDLPEVITQGETSAEGLEAAAGALQAALQVRMEEGGEIPLPSVPQPGESLVGVPVDTALKAAIYRSVREQGLSKSELARRLGVDEKVARRLLEARHRTRVAALEDALGALGCSAEVIIQPQTRTLDASAEAVQEAPPEYQARTPTTLMEVPSALVPQVQALINRRGKA